MLEINFEFIMLPMKTFMIMAKIICSDYTFTSVFAAVEVTADVKMLILIRLRAVRALTLLLWSVNSKIYLLKH